MPTLTVSVFYWKLFNLCTVVMTVHIDFLEHKWYNLERYDASCVVMTPLEKDPLK